MISLESLTACTIIYIGSVVVRGLAEFRLAGVFTSLALMNFLTALESLAAEISTVSENGVGVTVLNESVTHTPK